MHDKLDISFLEQIQLVNRMSHEAYHYMLKICLLFSSLGSSGADDEEDDFSDQPSSDFSAGSDFDEDGKLT